MKRTAVVLSAVIALLACGAAKAANDTPAASATAEATAEATTPEATTPEATTTTEAPTTTVKRECTNGATENRNVTDTSYDIYRCSQEGQWSFLRTETIKPTTTTTTIPHTTIRAGTSLVGSEIQPGMYRVVRYWARLDATMEIIDNDGVYDNRYALLNVQEGDAVLSQTERGRNASCVQPHTGPCRGGI